MSSIIREPRVTVRRKRRRDDLQQPQPGRRSSAVHVHNLLRPVRDTTRLRRDLRQHQPHVAVIDRESSPRQRAAHHRSPPGHTLPAGVAHHFLHLLVDLLLDRGAQFLLNRLRNQPHQTLTRRRISAGRVTRPIAVRLHHITDNLPHVGTAGTRPRLKPFPTKHLHMEVGVEVGIVRTNRTVHKLHHRRGTTRLHVVSRDTSSAADRARRVTTAGAAVGDTDRETTSQTRGPCTGLRSREVTRAPLPTAGATEDYVGDTGHEARAVRTTGAVRGAAEHVRAAVTGPRPHHTAHQRPRRRGALHDAATGVPGRDRPERRVTQHRLPLLTVAQDTRRGPHMPRVEGVHVLHTNLLHRRRVHHVLAVGQQGRDLIVLRPARPPYMTTGCEPGDERRHLRGAQQIRRGVPHTAEPIVEHGVDREPDRGRGRLAHPRPVSRNIVRPLREARSRPRHRPTHVRQRRVHPRVQHPPGGVRHRLQRRVNPRTGVHLGVDREVVSLRPHTGHSRGPRGRRHHSGVQPSGVHTGTHLPQCGVNPLPRHRLRLGGHALHRRGEHPISRREDRGVQLREHALQRAGLDRRALHPNTSRRGRRGSYSHRGRRDVSRPTGQRVRRPLNLRPHRVHAHHQALTDVPAVLHEQSGRGGDTQRLLERGLNPAR